VWESVPQVPTDPRSAPHNTQWTPPQWAQPALNILSVTYPPFTIDDQQTAEVSIDYVFDAVFKVIHRRVLRKTSHPVLTGPNISDHAYIEPTRVSLEIGMSDAMAAYKADMWTGGFTKSLSAWQKIKEFQTKKLIITLVTRLDTYPNMMVIEAEAPDDNVSRHGLRATVILEELLSATVKVFPPISARDQVSDSTSVGIVQATAPNDAQVDQHQIPEYLKPGNITWDESLQVDRPMDTWGALPDGTQVPIHLYDGEHMSGNTIWKTGDLVPTGSPF
jgi:hypothetical protein